MGLRIPIMAVVTDGVTEGSEEVFIPVEKLSDPDKEAYTTKYGSKTVEVKTYQTDLLGELFKLRGISSRNQKS